MEIAPHVLEKLHVGHKLNTVIEARLVEDFIKSTRILTLIENNDPKSNGILHALLIFQTTRFPIHSSIDLQLVLVIPVDIHLKCEIDASTTDSNSVVINVTSGNTRLLFEMPFGQRTNAFVSDVLKAAEVIGKKKVDAPDFGWLQEYMANIKLIDSKMPSKGNFDSIPENSELNSNSTENQANGKSTIRMPAAKYVADSTFFTDRSAEYGVKQQNVVLGVSTPVEARERDIKLEMAKREESYTYIEKHKIFVGTWNVNGQYPSVGLAEWLATDDEPPDIYAVAFQELDLNTETFLFNTTPREQEWLNAVLNSVHPKAKYKKVRLVRLIGMMLIVLVQEKHIAFIRNISQATVGTGIMNKMGNKGAVSIRLEFYNTSICFVNPHMAAHVEEFERRNQDYNIIMDRTAFSDICINGLSKKIWNHDHIYFFGDMNYRINPGNYDIRKLASEGDFQILMENDQLTIQKNDKNVFQNFEEGEIKFKPTFKYDLNTDNWDSSEKARQPAWCDRILWKGQGIEQKVYRSHPTLKISDHKPVSAIFDSGIKKTDPKRHRKVYEEVMKNLDRLENEGLPQVDVDKTEIIFDNVKFLENQRKSLTISNTGRSSVDFMFDKKLNEDVYCKSWLSVIPPLGNIRPGEKCEVSFEVTVDKRTAFKFNSGRDKLYDILILKLVEGKHIFITVTGDYERSCFGSSINALVHLSRPFRDATLSLLIDLESKSPKNLSEMPYAVPKELWYLLNHLHSYGMKVDGLFVTSGLQKELNEIRDTLDAGVPDDILPGSVYSVAEALLLFLEALPEPVIPCHLYHKALEATPNFSSCVEVISELPDHHRNVFSHLISFLRELLEHAQENSLDAKTLALVFGSILLREPDSGGFSKEDHNQPGAIDRKKQTFIYNFLVNDYNL